MKKLLLIAIGIICISSAKANQPFNPEIDFGFNQTNQDTLIVDNLKEFRKGQNNAKIVHVVGYSLTLLGNSMVFFASTFPYAYPMIVVGGVVVIVAYIVDWHSLKHLKFKEPYE